MNPAWITASSGLAGALIGSCTVLASKAQDNRNQRAERRRDELRDVLSRFWVAADMQWRTAQDLAWAVYEVTASRQAGTMTPQLDERRRAIIGEHGRAKRDVDHLLAALRLLGSPIVPDPVALQEASRFTLDQASEWETRRSTALYAYEAHAQRLLGVKDRADWAARYSG